MTGDARDEITFVHDVVIYIVTQHSPYLTPETIYAPTRSFDISHPGWKVNGRGGLGLLDTRRVRRLSWACLSDAVSRD